MKLFHKLGLEKFSGAARSVLIRRLTVMLLLVAGAIELTGCVTTDRSLITGRKRAYAYSWAEEVKLGQEADQSIIAQYGLYDDPDLTHYVDSLGQVLLRFSEARAPGAPQEVRATPFTFRVLDSPVVNAFALPGGFVYVTRGLMAHLENEAQLAVVLGHEIGHVVGRHASIRAVNQTFGQALVLGGAIGGQVLLGGDAANTILQGGSTVAQLAFLSHGRDAERESDRLGVEYAIQAGYNAEESAEFFNSLKRLSGDSGSSIPSFLSTHPDPGEREQTIYELAAEWAKTHPVGKDGRDALLARVDDIVAGEDPRQGFVEANTFFHPGLAFQFPIPQGYQTINQPSQVVLIAEDERSAIRFYLESGVSTPREAAERFAAQDGLQVVQSGLGSSYGLPAQFVIVDAPDQNGNVTRARAHFVQYNGQIYGFLGFAAQADYAAREQGFVQAMQGFAPLRDPARLAVEPLRVDVRQVSQRTTFAGLVPSGGVNQFSADELAILNQLQLDTVLEVGSRVKLVR
ncbi:MAG: M48 family metalloprotease [Rhodothermales bacterium]|nr:M48 family metalloprotease [Rhodothermales bacterium]MBO6778856.1 M48 family metalloprotease [Rhodothermales bacterium]